MLKAKIALVTGSTRGIGAGIAEVLAAEGCNIVLNGMGDAAAIATQRERLSRTFGVEAVYDGADMSEPAAIEGMIVEAMEPRVLAGATIDQRNGAKGALTLYPARVAHQGGRRGFHHLS